MASDAAREPSPLARPIRGVIGARLREAKLSAVDSAVGKADSWAKKILSGDCGVLLDDIELFLGALDLKAVDVSKVCVDRATAAAYETIAKRAMAKEQTLLWDDAE